MYTVYTTPLCEYCSMTKNLLNTYNLEYLAIDLDTTEKKENFKRTTGFKTVPQIYNGAGDHIGGYDELVEYLNRGKTP